LTVDRCGLLVSIYIIIPLLDAALPLKSIMKNVPMREFWRESMKMNRLYIFSLLKKYLTLLFLL